jgi:hypothetical protein
MTPIDNLTLEKQEDDRANAAFERRIDGTSDAALCYLPVFNNEEYLRGWLAGILSFPTDEKGRIIYPKRSFDQAPTDFDEEF